MGKKETIDTLVDGGKASPGPAIAPKLAMMKMPIQDIFKQINDKTKEYAGMKVPVKIIIDLESKSFDVRIGTPPVSSLIKKELGIEKAKYEEVKEAEPAVEAAPAAEKTAEEKPKLDKKVEEKVEEKKVEEVKATEPAAVVEKKPIASITVEQCVKVAKMKIDSMLAKDLKAALKQVVGTCKSMQGIQVDGKDPNEVIKEINDGKYDHLLK